MRETFIWYSILAVLIGYSHGESMAQNDKQPTFGAYMDMKPTNTPKLLAPDLLASSLDEYNGTFSPDGKEFFFTTNTPKKGIVCHTQLDDKNQWTTPKVAVFSGNYSEYDPLFSPDGKRLYFTSERPKNADDSSGKTNIWFVNKLDSTWSEPILLPLDQQGPYYSSITNEGRIYFNVWDTGDLYKASVTDQGYETDTLPAILNSSNGEGDPFISPEEDYIIFRGYNNTLGQGDLYISFKVNETWSEPENLGEPINSSAHEMCPYVTTDGRYFIFSSARLARQYDSEANQSIEEVREKHQTADNEQLNIYYISADFISEKRKNYQEK